MGIISDSWFKLYDTDPSQPIPEVTLNVVPKVVPPDIDPDIPGYIFIVPNLSWTTVGSTQTLDSGLTFQRTVRFLTDGKDGLIDFVLGHPGERRLFGMGVHKHALNGGYPGIDLRGYTIQALELTPNSYNQWKDDKGVNWAEVQIRLVIRGEFPFWWRFLSGWGAFTAGILLGGLVVGAASWALGG